MAIPEPRQSEISNAAERSWDSRMDLLVSLLLVKLDAGISVCARVGPPVCVYV